MQSKIIPRLKMLHKVRLICNQTTAVMLYKTLISPIIDYGDILDVGITQQEKFKIQRLQNCACRIVLRRGCMESTDVMHSELNLDKLDLRRYKHDRNQMYKCMTGLAPEILCNKIKKVGDVHERVTRAALNHQLVVSDTRSTVRRKISSLMDQDGGAC